MLRSASGRASSFAPFRKFATTFSLLFLFVATAALLWQTTVHDVRSVRAATNFTPGNIVVYRVGDGSAAITSAATAVFLDEYTPGGVLVQSIPMPTAVNGANKRLTNSGTATSEGLMTLSGDGHYLIAAGYDAAPGTASVTTSTSAAVNRVIARVDANGNVDTTTALTDAISGGNPRGAASTNGTDLWISGTSSGGGIRYAAFGTTTSTSVSVVSAPNIALTNLRAANIFGGQLYITTASGATRLDTVGTGAPTTAGQVMTTLPGFPSPASPYGFFFAQLNPASGGVDTVYIADDSTAAAGGGLQKYSLSGGVWVASGTVGVGTNSLSLRGVTGTVTGGVATLYAVGSSTTVGTLYSFVDNTGQGGTITGSLNTVASSATNKVFRGVGMAPVSNGPTNPSGSGASNPNPAQQGGSTKLTVTVTPGTNPPSTGLTVRADLNGINGLSSQSFFDDGTNGDVTAGDNVFTYQTAIPLSIPPGPQTFSVAIRDAQGRTGNTSISLTVNPASTSPTGVGAASPSSLQAGNPTLLTVAVTAGTNPISSGLAVVGNLASIGGSSTQQFFDDGTNGDAHAGDNIFSFAANVPTGTSAGAKSLPITVTDAQARSSNTSIALTIQPPPPPNTLKISQVYGGGGNSGATYTNDFIEIFNNSNSPVNISGWSVQEASATVNTAWAVTPLVCPQNGCVIPAYHYYLIQEGPGAGGTTAPPAPDATGTIALSATNAKVALVAGTDPISGACPTGGAIVDVVGYGSATCFETAATPALTNTTAALRKNNGCLDTDNNLNDFIIGGPIPRNLSSPANFCGATGQLSGQGLATPNSVLPASNSLLTVAVTPAANPTSSGISVVADLTAFTGNSAEAFYDDGTHGDALAGDGIYSFLAPAPLTTGIHATVANITDTQGRSSTAPITMTVVSPTCGVERWSVKVGTDPDAALVNLNNPIHTTIADLGALSPPPDPPGPPDNQRVLGVENNVYVVNGTLTFYKLETDVDYHMVLQDDQGRTMVVEIPNPACILAPGTPRVLVDGPFKAGITATREKFDAHFTAQTFFQTANVPVQVKGVGFFDFAHGQTGLAPNAIELHPVIELNFTQNTTAVLTSSLNASQFGQPVTLSATITSAGSATPTGSVTFQDGGSPIGTANLDPNGNASVTTNSLTVGSHTLRVVYGGDSASAPSTSAPISQQVNKADQSITFSAISNKTFGDAPINAIATGGASGNPVTFSASGNCASSGTNGSTITITGAGSCSVTASQAGNGSYNDAADVVRSFNIGQAMATVRVTGYVGIYDGHAHGASGTATGVNGADVSSLLNLGASFTDAPGGTAHWTFSGSADYASTSGDVSIAISAASAVINVAGYSGIYDGHAHGATGTAMGINGEDLNGLLNLGASFTDAPGGTANWAFAGNVDYLPASGSANIVIGKATPTFSSLSSPSITFGTANTVLSGHVGAGALVPAGNISITLNGVTQTAAIDGAGKFSSSFATGALAPVAAGYAISYSYAGGTDFNPASGAGTLTIGYGVALLYDPSKAANGGSTIPIKIDLTNAAGANVSSAGVVVTAIQLVQVSSNATSTVQDSGNANPDGNFRFDGSGYIFNLSTKGLASGTYNLVFRIQGDPTQHSIPFQVR